MCVEVNDCVDEYMCYSVNSVLVKMSRTQNRSEAAISKSDVQKRHIWEYIRTHILNTWCERVIVSALILPYNQTTQNWVVARKFSYLGLGNTIYICITFRPEIDVIMSGFPVCETALNIVLHRNKCECLKWLI